MDRAQPKQGRNLSPRQRKRRQRRKQTEEYRRQQEARELLTTDDSLIVPPLCQHISIEASCRVGSVLAEAIQILMSLQEGARDIMVENAEQRYRLQELAGLSPNQSDFALSQSLRSKTKNIDLVATPEGLRATLKNRSPDVPILISGQTRFAESFRVGKEIPNSFLSFVEQFPGNVSVNIQAYNAPASNDTPIFSTTTDVATLIERQNYPGGRHFPFNCLDMGNLIMTDLVPPDIRREDLFHKASLLSNSNSFSRPLATMGKEISQFCLLSEKGSASRPHVDGAQATWIMCLTGQKLWLYGKPIPSMKRSDLRRLVHFGLQEPESMDFTWSRVLLCPGDFL